MVSTSISTRLRELLDPQAVAAQPLLDLRASRGAPGSRGAAARPGLTFGLCVPGDLDLLHLAAR